jgi:hypothetical protein
MHCLIQFFSCAEDFGAALATISSIISGFSISKPDPKSNSSSIKLSESPIDFQSRSASSNLPKTKALVPVESGVGRLTYPNIDIDVCFPAVEIYLTHVVADEQVPAMTSLTITMILNSLNGLNTN